jgi:leader peptidase (prepilin peptidase)/N-methyltransferase
MTDQQLVTNPQLTIGAGAGPVGPVLLAAGLIVVLAVSPVLAGWSAALAGGVRDGWWRPRRVGWRRWVTVAATAVLLTAASAAGRPWPAWWLFAAGAAVLLVVDAQHHLLPARLVYPLAAAVAAALTVAAISGGEWHRLLRAVLAAAVAAAGWLAVKFAAPAAVGLGDVRLFALTAGLLGWLSWWAVLYGEMVAFVLAGIMAVLMAVLAPRRPIRGQQVPLGPAIIVGALLVCWL